MNKNFNITFVTSLIDIYDKPINGRSLDWRFEHFEKLVQSNLPICLFISQKYYDYFNEKLINLSNKLHPNALIALTLRDIENHFIRE